MYVVLLIICMNTNNFWINVEMQWSRHSQRPWIPRAKYEWQWQRPQRVVSNEKHFQMEKWLCCWSYTSSSHLLQSKFLLGWHRRRRLWHGKTSPQLCLHGGVAARTAADVWKNIKHVTLKANSASIQPKTGVGPPPPWPWFADNLLNVLGDQTSLVECIEGRNTKSVITVAWHWHKCSVGCLHMHWLLLLKVNNLFTFLWYNFFV